MGNNRKRNSDASAISDRSGIRFPMNEMVIEPGTNYLVHRSESDGQYSLVRHPLSNLGRYLKNKMGDPFPVENARPDISWNNPITWVGSVFMSADSSLSVSTIIVTAQDWALNGDWSNNGDWEGV